MNKYIIKLKDGGVTNITSDSWCESSGCETCDYGSEYIKQFEVELERSEIEIKLSDMYYTPSISTEDLIKMFCENLEEIKNKTEKEFVEWVKDYMCKLSESKEYEYEPEIKVKMLIGDFIKDIESKDNIPPVKSSPYYTEEDTTILYISNNELLLNAEEIEEFLKVNEPINSYDSEGVASFSFKSKDITIDFLIEMEDILDERIIFCRRYLGSVKTIKSLGLD